MAELRAADLRFTHREVAALFSRLALADLDEDQIATLESRSEGWIAGLQMIALSLRGREDVDGFVTSLSGSHRHIADYMADQVLDRQSADVQDFLLRTAILNRLTGPLCDAVAGHSDSQAVLEQLERDNLFLISLDDERCWYRYHHLFADLLRARLERKYPGQSRDLHRRASEWFRSIGDLDNALAHGRAAGDVARVLDLLDRHAETLWSRGQYATLLKWLDELGDEAIRPRHRLRVHHALTSFIAGELSAGAARLRALENELAIDVQGDTPIRQSPSMALDRSTLTGMIAAGHTYIAYYQRNVGDMIRFARAALDHLDESSALWRSGLAVVLGNAYEHSGQIAAATQAFAEALAAGRATDSGFLSLTAGVHLAINHVHRGQLRDAVQICREQTAAGRLSGIPAAGALHSVWGDVLREWNEMGDARRHVERGCDLCGRGPGIAMLGWSRLALVRLLFSEQDLEGAERILNELEALAEAPPWVTANLAAWRARVWLAQGRLKMASRLLEARALDVAGEISFLRLSEYLALARVNIVRGIEQSDPVCLTGAAHLLTRLRQASESGGWIQSLIQVLVLLALACHAQGETEQGLDALNEALILAEPHGFVRTFLDEGAPVVQLLRRAEVRKDVSVYVRELLSAAGDAPGASVPPLDPLSERELQVLRLMANGLSNREIGNRLFITTGTVKVHASNIYSKLGVGGRVQAVAWARDLNLL